MLEGKACSAVDRVLFLSHTDIRSDSRILKEMRAALDRGFDVLGIGVEMDEGSKNTQDIVNRIEAIRLATRYFRFLPTVIRHFLTFIELFFKSFWKSSSAKPNLIHANDTLVLPIAVFVKLFTGAELVYDAHELESDRNGLSKPLGFLTKLVEKLCWPFVNGLIVVSPSIQSWYLENIGEKPSEVILNSPAFEVSSEQDKGYLRRKFNIPEDELVFIYVGILGRGRGIDLILDAFESLSGAHIVFLGYGEYADRLSECSRYRKNLHVHEAVEHNRVVEVASSADVGLCLVQNVSLSDYFCLPNKLFEYAFAGLPVLASNFPDIRKVVDDYSLGRCVDLTPESIREGIQWFLGDQGNLKKPDADIKSLSWQTQEQKLVSFYEQISR
ncbi:MAG: glycosyltransferase [Alteromonadaceae bacterium]|nr:glycosyltransferase [Alteromonadaceae bacterium]